MASGTCSKELPATVNAYDTTFRGYEDVFIARLDMGVSLYGDVHEVSLSTGW